MSPASEGTTLYHVQLETRDVTVSYEIATNDFDAVQIATADLTPHLPEGTQIWCGGVSRIGYTRFTPLVSILERKLLTGTLPPVGFDGKPVKVVFSESPSGGFIGTDQVIVSPLKPLKDT